MLVESADVRIARALGTAQMLAILALGSLALEERPAFMACPAHPLRWGFPSHFFPGRGMDHGERTSLLV